MACEYQLSTCHPEFSKPAAGTIRALSSDEKRRNENKDGIPVCTFHSTNNELKEMQTRLDTFNIWPHIRPSAHDVAEAGFYYEGFGDAVRCFCCNQGVRHWRQEDNPFEAHAFINEWCPFLEETKGSKWITEFKESLALEEAAATRDASKARQTSRKEESLSIKETEVETVPEMLEKNKTLKEKLACSKCRKSRFSHLLQPCGHVFCETCANAITHCPTCRRFVQTTTKIFM